MDLNTLRASVDALTERTGAAVSRVETGLKVVNDEIEQLHAALKRTGGDASAGNDNNGDLRAEHKALSALIRTGEDSQLREIAAAHSVGSDPDGGYLVTPQRSAGMTRRLWDSVTMRRISRVVTLETGDRFEEPIDNDEVGATWVGEQSGRPDTGSADLGMLTVPLDEIFALTTITQRLLDDSAFDVGGWIDGKHVDKYARSENTAFISGNGIGKPRGLLTYPTTTETDFNRAWGTIQTVASGAATAVTADALKDMVTALRQPYRAGARWLMNSQTLGFIEKIKDGEGNYLLSPVFAEGGQRILLGYAVEVDETMPDLAADSLSIAFGNFSLAYTIVDRPGIKYLRDPFTAKPHVLFYSYKRVGGRLANSEAVKLLQTTE